MTEYNVIALSQVALWKSSESFRIKDASIYIFKNTCWMELLWMQHQWSKNGLCWLSRDYNSKDSSFYLLCLTASSQTAWINLGINMLPVYLERITVLSALGDQFISRFNSAWYDRPQLLSQASYLQSMPWFNEYMFSSLSKPHTELHTAGTQDI